MASNEARLKYARKNEEFELRRAFLKLDKNKDNKIDADELASFFSSLGHKVKKSEVEDLIWEVDEDCDQTVSWKEFQTMYQRCNTDTAGLEPRGFFNVVQFVMSDRESVGSVSLQEAMQLVYLRYGRAQLDTQLEAVFGTSDLNSGKTLSLTDFLAHLHANQVAQLRSRVTAKTYKPPPLPSSKGPRATN